MLGNIAENAEILCGRRHEVQEQAYTCTKMPLVPKAAGIVPTKLLWDAFKALRAGNMPSLLGSGPLL
jgi:hypothetical protein